MNRARPILRSPTGGKPRAFGLLLVSYLLFLSVPLLLVGLLSRGVTDAVRQQALDARLVALERCRDVLDVELRSVDDALVQTAMNSRIFTFLSVTDALHGPGISRVLDAWQELSRVGLPSHLTQELFLFSSRSGVVLSPAISYVRMECFDADFWSCAGRTFAQWRSEALVTMPVKRWIPEATVRFRGKAVRVLTQVRALPLGASAPAGAALVFVRVDDLEAALCPPGERTQTGIAVLSQDGTVLLGRAGGAPSLAGRLEAPIPRRSNASATRAGGRWLLSVTSSYNGWTYLLDVPESLLMVQLLRLRRVLGAGFLLLALLGAAAAAVLARWQTRPIRGVMSALSASLHGAALGTGNEYEQIQGLVERLLEGNRDLAKAVTLQAPMVRHSFLSRLLRGELADRVEVETLAPQAGVDLRCDRFLVLVAVLPACVRRSAPEIATLGLARAALARFLERSLPGNEYVVETDIDEVSVLVCSADGLPEHAETLARSLRASDGVRPRALPALGGGTASGNPAPVTPFVGAGTVVDGVMGICLSYANARTAARHACHDLHAGDGLVWYSELPKGQGMYSYPLSLESRIVTLAHQGDRESVDELLRWVYRENFEQRQLTEAARLVLCRELIATVGKAAENLRVPLGEGEVAAAFRDLTLSLEEAAQDTDAQRFFLVLRATYSALCTGAEDRRRRHSRRLRDEILAYVAASSADPNLCLQSVAERFRLNEFYVSQFFKEHTGENFHQHLERLRLRSACRLLAKTDVAVAEIARVVGYASPGTFRKALRRVVGLTPRDVRRGGAVEGELGSLPLGSSASASTSAEASAESRAGSGI
jgi:two-component system, response regulator YesN